MTKTSGGNKLKMLFTSRIRVSVLEHLALSGDEELGVRELARHLEEDYRNVNRELNNLHELGFLTISTTGAKSVVRRARLLKGSLFGELWAVIVAGSEKMSALVAFAQHTVAEAVIFQPTDQGITLFVIGPGAQTEADLRKILESEGSNLSYVIVDSAHTATFSDLVREWFAKPCLIIANDLDSLLSRKPAIPRDEIIPSSAGSNPRPRSALVMSED